jgi:hypothetical protein
LATGKVLRDLFTNHRPNVIPNDLPDLRAAELAVLLAKLIVAQQPFNLAVIEAMFQHDFDYPA